MNVGISGGGGYPSDVIQALSTVCFGNSELNCTTSGLLAFWNVHFHTFFMIMPI